MRNIRPFKHEKARLPFGRGTGPPGIRRSAPLLNFTKLISTAAGADFQGERRHPEPVPWSGPILHRPLTANNLGRGARFYPGALDRPIAATCPPLLTIPLVQLPFGRSAQGFNQSLLQALFGLNCGNTLKGAVTNNLANRR